MGQQGRFVVPIADDVVPDPDLLGQKGAGLLVMRRLGLPVPPGVILTTGLYRVLAPTIVSSVNDSGQAPAPLQLPDELWAELWAELEPALAGLAAQERWPRRDDSPPPMLWAVRSGAPISMPGMLDSILNLGLNAQTVVELASWSQNRRFAVDCYRRFLRQYAQSVLGVSLLSRQRLGTSAQRADLGPDADELRAECAALKDEIRQRGGATVPDSPAEQLRAAIAAVLGSYLAPRARDYRSLTGMPRGLDELGTAVVVQAMVFGNRSEQSGTGVIFSRDPATGEPQPYGEFLPCAQGEDVVSGTAMPQPLSQLALRLPTVHAELCQAAALLERQAGDLQDIEFTVEEGQLWLLQARSGKRSGRAMVRIAADLAREGLLTPDAALLRIDPRRLGELLYPMIESEAPRTLLARGLPASPGVAIGQVAFSVAEVEAHAQAGTRAILVRTDTATEDIRGIQLAAGVLTSRGGMTSHAAVVARGLGRCAVVGASSIRVDAKAQTLSTREHTVQRGELLTVDGNSGEVLLGAMPLSTAHLAANRDLVEILGWSARRRLRIYAVADSLSDWQLSQQLGAEGIGLCRTESLLLESTAPAAGSSQSLTAGLSAELAARLSLLPGRPVFLRLFDPMSAQSLRQLASAAVPAPAPLHPDFIARSRQTLLRALLGAMASLAPRGVSVQPQLLLPRRVAAAGAGAADIAPAIAELRQQLEILVAPSSAAAPPPPIGLGVEVSDLAGLRAVTAPGDDCGDFVVLAVRTLDEVRVGLEPAVLAAHKARPGLRLGICLLDGSAGLGERSVMGWLDGLGLEFVACPPLRMAVAAVATAQASLQR